ncbi:MAG: hypothetical protein P8Y23_00045 [Candidatus Lokiarchaeota archaeon]|jgi:peptidoglycan/LPS O-acetylase OafA/YrhL
MIDKKVKETIGIFWLIILIILWVSYPFMPGDIFFWMWVAIGWSILGGVISTIFFMAESKKNEKIIGTIWVIVLIFLWIFFPFLPGETFGWYLFALIWSIVGGLIALVLFIIKRSQNE